MYVGGNYIHIPIPEHRLLIGSHTLTHTHTHGRTHVHAHAHTHTYSVPCTVRKHQQTAQAHTQSLYIEKAET